MWWLGKRSVRHYLLQSSTGFMKFAVNCRQSGTGVRTVEGKPDYQALADTLKRAFKQLDKTFLDDFKLTLITHIKEGILSLLFFTVVE
ncbi:DUF412 family protein [Escherichia coli]